MQVYILIKTNNVTMCDEYEYTDPIIICNERDLPDNGMKEFHFIDSKKVLLIKQKGKIYAVGAKCPHFGGPLKDGVVGNGRIRCPWHGACFDIKSGDIEDFPGLDSLPCYKVETKKNGQVGIMIRLKDIDAVKRIKDMVKRDLDDPTTFVVIGGGPAAQICVETLRQEGYVGRIILVCKEPYLPYDRVKISKTFYVTIEALQYRQKEFYDEYGIEIYLNTEATNVKCSEQVVKLSNGKSIKYDKMFIATGCTPKIPSIIGVNLKNIVTLRTYDDLAIISETMSEETRIICLGTGVITLEIAQDLIKQVESVTIVTNTELIASELFGDRIAERILRLFTDNHVNVITNTNIIEIIGNLNGEIEKVILANSKLLPCDLLIIDAELEMNTKFLKGSGLKINNNGSIDTNIYLRTSVESIYVGGDIANAPVYSMENELGTISNYKIAQYHGRIAAINMIKSRSKMLRAVPFFFTKLFEKNFRFSGYGQYSNIIIDGNLEDMKFVAYFVNENNKVMLVGSCDYDPIVSQFAELQSQGGTLKLADIKNDEVPWTKMIKSD
uniref:Rieske domain-containing protein n=1 Tax=Glossina brevipalpis TaxID=37001 RepID=A0A1A9WK94_9MUSC